MKIHSLFCISFTGSVLATLSASDPDDSTLQFALIGDIANDLLTLTKTGPKSANVVLASSLDREVRIKLHFPFLLGKFHHLPGR